MSAAAHEGDPGVRPSTAADLDAIEAIMVASLAIDGIPGFTRHDIDRAMSRIPVDFGATVVAVEGERIVGYCAPRHDDLTVDPEHRREGHGRRLVEAAVALVRARGEPHLQLYVPLHLEASVRFAEACGFRYVSSLWLFELPAEAGRPAPAFGADYILRSYRPDEDVETYVDFVTAAFEGHPTPIGLTPELARHVAGLPDFDPQGILIVAPASEPERPVGFAKVEMVPVEGGPPTGYVAQVGVLPAWRGRGLGRELLRWGVGYLRDRGATRIELSVEAANDRATALYRSEGFRPAVEWPHWIRPV